MVTLVPHNLYDVQIPDSEGNRLLMDIVRNEYHTLTTQCLHTSKRARSDLQTSILFHCTRVQRSNTDDQKKLARTFRHIIGLGGVPVSTGLPGAPPAAHHIPTTPPTPPRSTPPAPLLRVLVVGVMPVSRWSTGVAPCLPPFCGRSLWYDHGSAGRDSS
jgi:hypothetical protein